MTAGVTPEREAEIRAMAWKTGRSIDLAHALARITLALRDALSLVDAARADATDTAGYPLATVLGLVRRDRNALIAMLVPLTCGSADLPTTPSEKALVALDDAIDKWTAGVRGRAGVLLRASFAELQQEVWQALADECTPLHNAVKHARACTCPKEGT